MKFPTSYQFVLTESLILPFAFLSPIKINAAGLRYRSLLKQWTTHATLSPKYTDQSEAYFESSGFFGDYDVVLQLPNGLTSTQKFTLSPGNGPLGIELHLPGSVYLSLGDCVAFLNGWIIYFKKSNVCEPNKPVWIIDFSRSKYCFWPHRRQELS